MDFEYEYKKSGHYELDAYNHYNDEDYEGDEDLVCELVMYKGHHHVIMPPEIHEGLNTVTIEKGRTLVCHEDTEFMIWLKKCDFGMRYILESMKMDNSLFKDEEDHTDYMCRILQRGMEGFHENRDRIVSNLTCHNIIIDYEIVKKVLTNAYRWQDRDFLEELMKFGSQIGNMYYNAIILDDLETIVGLEKYGFPTSDEFDKSEDPFVRMIPLECRRFKANKLLHHFNLV